jgi:hypothetical protein
VLGATLGWGVGSAGAEVFGGVDFPAGAVSFADAVAAYDPAAGASTLPDAEFQDPTLALGPPDVVESSGFVSLGDGGVLVVEVTDNVLVGDGGTGDDLHVFEAGAAEGYEVAVSADGVAFTDVGTLFGSDGVDLDAFGFGPDDELRFVRLTDDGDSADVTGPVGADIDAIGAISTVAVFDLTIEKVADHGGTYAFDVLAGGAPVAELSVPAGGSATAAGVVQGTVVVTEAVPAGQRLDAVACTDDAGAPVEVLLEGAEVTLDLTGDTTCTFTNVLLAAPVDEPDVAPADDAEAPAAPVQGLPTFTG